MTIQYIKDEEGKDQYVVIPYSDYFRMRLALLEYDDEDESDWEDIPYESDIYDDVMLPGEVCDVMHKENVSLQAAWRILRGMSQQEVAEKVRQNVYDADVRVEEKQYGEDAKAKAKRYFLRFIFHFCAFPPFFSLFHGGTPLPASAPVHFFPPVPLSSG